ncbi:ABC transporter permease [Sphingobium cloacae]|uniref:Multidrug ABC transporter substrate-binding protein n=1 Tax=Sphingobium cloacae TaxID=120107 RepID=A0A1E1F509_9SPHN|nr:ABC transporter permease [Sphingobium cloacae]BAV65587.1 multidrug ABC transporter substrate-binding protein [Sphingobium cloacae]
MLALLPVNIHLAIQSLNRNRMRSLLTMLGIIIGIAAVLTMIALGTGARASVEDEVGSAGTKLIFVKAGNYTRGGESVGIAAGLGAARTLMPADAEAIAGEVAGIRAISPRVSARTTISSGEARSFARVQGVGPDFAKAYSWTFSNGRMFGDGGEEAVIGRVLADRLFGTGAAAVGKQVEARGATFHIVGVIPGESEDQGEELFVPWRALQSRLGGSHIEAIVIAAEKAGEASRMGDDIKALLRRRHGLSPGSSNQSYLGAQGGGSARPDDFTVETQAAQALTKGLYTPAAAFALANLPKLDEVTLEEMASTLDRASDTMTALLASIAGVSLIVGGIGIMNIMLVSVTERTREIGLRVATGARSADVAMQFLVEAVMLSLIGGLIGLALGLLSSRLIGWSLGWPVEVSFGAIMLAIGISLLVGLVFGIYPARRASLFDPIDALRSE